MAITNSTLKLLISVQGRGIGKVKQLQKAIDGASNSLDKYNKSLQAINTAGKQLITTGVAMATALYFPVKNAVEYEKAIANIQTLLDEEEFVEKYRKEVIELSNEFGVSAVELAGGLYKIESGLRNSAIAMDVLKESTLLARVAQGSLKNAVDRMVILMQLYKGEINNAAEASTFLNDTIRIGRTRLEDLTSSFDDAISSAKLLNIPLETTQVLFIQLTRTIGSVAKAGTFLNRFFTALIKDQERFKKAGIDVNETLSQENGMIKLLQQLQEVTKGNASEIRKIVKDYRSFGATARFLGTGLTSLKEIQADLESSTLTLAQRYERLALTTSIQLQIFQQRAKNLSITLGNVLLPEIQKTVNGFNAIVDVFKTTIDTMDDFTKQQLASFIIQMTKATLVLGAFLTFITTIGGAFFLLTKTIIGVSTVMGGLYVILSKVVVLLATGLVAAAGAASTALASLTLTTALLVAGFAALIAIFVGAALIISDWFKKNEKGAKSSGKNIKEEFTKLEESIENLKVVYLNAKAVLVGLFGDKKQVTEIRNQIKFQQNYIKVLKGIIGSTKGVNYENDRLFNGISRLNLIYETAVEKLILMTNAGLESAKTEAQRAFIIEKAQKKIIAILEKSAKAYKEQAEAFQASGDFGRAANNLEALAKVEAQILKLRTDAFGFFADVRIKEEKKLAEETKKQYKQALATIKEGSKEWISIEKSKFKTLKLENKKFLEDTKDIEDQKLQQIIGNSNRRLSVIQEEYEVRRNLLQSELDYLIKNRKEINAKTIAEETQLKEELKQIEIQFQTDKQTLEEETQQKIKDLREKELEEFRNRNQQKIQELQSYYAQQEELDQLSVQSGEIGEAEALDRRMDRLRSFYAEKLALLVADEQKARDINGRMTAESEAIIDEMIALEEDYYADMAKLEAENEAKLTQLREQGLQSYNQIMQERTKLSQEQVEIEQQKIQDLYDEGILSYQEYQDALFELEEQGASDRLRTFKEEQDIRKEGTEDLLLLTNEQMQGVADIFNEILGQTYTTFELFKANVDALGIEGFPILEQSIEGVKTKLKGLGIDLTRDVGEAGKEILDGLTSEVFGSLNFWSTKFAEWADSLIQEMQSIDERVNQLTDQTEAQQGEYTNAVTRQYEERVAALKEQYSEEAQATTKFQNLLKLEKENYLQDLADAEEREAQDRARREEEEYQGSLDRTRGYYDTMANLAIEGANTVTEAVDTVLPKLTSGINNAANSIGVSTIGFLDNLNQSLQGFSDVGDATFAPNVNVDSTQENKFDVSITGMDPEHTETWARNTLIPILKREKDRGNF